MVKINETISKAKKNLLKEVRFQIRFQIRYLYYDLILENLKKKIFEEFLVTQEIIFSI